MQDYMEERTEQHKIIKELLERHTAGEDVRGEIEAVLSAITEKVIKKVCGENKQIYKPELDTWLDLEPFMFDENDLIKVINKSITDALRTYKQDKNTKFSSWYYTTLESDLINLKNEYNQERDKGALIDSMESFNQIVDEIGDVYDPSILENFRHISAGELEEISDKQLKYITLNVYLYECNKRITDEIAAAALGVERNTIQRYKKELQKSFAGSNERRKRRKKTDDLPALINEYGAIDPTPREAASRIKYGPPKDESEYKIIAENIKTVGGTVGQVISFKDEGKAWGNGYCIKCHYSLTTAGKCSNTNNCNG